MKSIQTKFIALILGCVLLCSIVIGGAGILNAKRVVDSGSAQLLNLLCDSSSKELDALLSRIEQSVKTLSVYALDRLESVERLKSDQTYLEEYTANLEPVALNAAGNTEGALAVYVRFNPDFAGPTSGLFYSKTTGSDEFTMLPPTDLWAYQPTDRERVGWYYEPMAQSSSMWMPPYYNKNIDVRMISYVIPIYVDRVPVGVVGMDIDFSVMEAMVEQTRVYQTGYARLVNQADNIIYQNDVDKQSAIQKELPVLLKGLRRPVDSAPYSYVDAGVKKWMTHATLDNGLDFVLVAPAHEINARAQELTVQLTVAALGILFLAVILTLILTRRLVHPLRELNLAAERIAQGDLSIAILHQSRDEVGTLAESFRQTVRHLQRYTNYINGLAYRDALTGTKNKAAYLEAIHRIEGQVPLASGSFGILIFDLNNLKMINDEKGHDMGDLVLVGACKTICQVFAHSPVYRIGGDEFVVLLEGADLQNSPLLLEHFAQKVDAWNQSPPNGLPLSIAQGLALYDAETDQSFNDVFQRADTIMYQNKAKMKSHA